MSRFTERCCSLLILALAWLSTTTWAKADCDLNCGRFCANVFGRTVCEPESYNACIQAQAACQVVGPVVEQAAALVAKNLTIAVILDPIQTDVLLTLNFIINAPNIPQIQRPVPVPKDIPPTGVTYNISFDCLYSQTFGGVPVYTAISDSGMPANFAALKRGDQINATAANASCNSLAGWQLVPSGAFLVVRTMTDTGDVTEYTVIGRSQTAGEIVTQIEHLIPKIPNFPFFGAKVDLPSSLRLYGTVIAQTGDLTVIDPIADRSGSLLTLPSSKISLSDAAYDVTRSGVTRRLQKIDITDKSFLSETQHEKTRLLLALVNRPRNFTPQAGRAAAFTGDIECAIAKTTPIYWQAYAFVKYARDAGLVRNGNQCRDQGFMASIIGDILGADDAIVGAVVNLFGDCICRDLF